MKPTCHPLLKIKARGLCSSCYNKVLRVEKALKPPPRMSNYEILAEELKKNTKYLYKLFEGDSVFYDKYFKRSKR